MKSKHTTVSLEDLLRVKRAERPPVEFWSRFEQELHARQLAAIVEPRPWWAPLIRVGAKFSRHQLPIGAAAVLALSFMTVREYRSLDAGSASAPEIALPAVQTLAYVEPALAPVASAMASPAPSAEQLEGAYADNESTPGDAVALTGRSAHVAPLFDQAPAVAEPTPSARAIAANLAAAQAADPGIMDDVFGSEVPNVEVRERPRDPLAQMSSPSESRRTRLLGTALPALASAYDVAVGSSDRVTRRLTEERLYDTISRIGLSGDRVAIKF